MFGKAPQCVQEFVLPVQHHEIAGGVRRHERRRAEQDFAQAELHQHQHDRERDAGQRGEEAAPFERELEPGEKNAAH
jgi:hypothetical protein